ncbi:MAG: AAA family ATPase [Planctomycetaceae bacterium]|nr:AAA family ATPase [Planctomycetaceae bacterium]
MLTTQEIIRTQINAKIPILFVEHFDFESIDHLIKESIMKVFPKADPKNFLEYRPGGEVNFWTKVPVDMDGSRSLVDFLSEFNNRIHRNEPVFLFLKNVNEMLRDPEVLAHLRMIADHTTDPSPEHRRVYVFIMSHEMYIPGELEHIIRVIQIAPPEDEEIRQIVQDIFYEHGNYPSDDEISELVNSLRGLSVLEIRQFMQLGIYQWGYDLERIKQKICEEKDQVILKSKLLKTIKVTEDLDDIGGLENLKKYLIQKKQIFAHMAQAKERCVDIPKGILIVGMPGCGKSLTAKVASSIFGLPLIQLDIGMLLGKYLGESESNFQKAIRLAEAVSPCVLWVDEIEKAFAGMETSRNGEARGGGNEVTTRLFGSFLTWMQEKKVPVYVVATSNQCTLPPEFYRKGRFDEIFSVYLPNKEERKKILEIHLKKRGCSVADLAEVIAKTDGFCGADLEGIVREAVELEFLEALKDDFRCWPKKKGYVHQISEKKLLEAIKETKSIKDTLGKKYDEMKNNLDEHNLKPASKK